MLMLDLYGALVDLRTLASIADGKKDPVSRY